MWSVVSSCAVPAGERFDWYADIISREVMPAALSSERPAEFQGEAAVLDLGDLRVAKFALSPLRSRRTPALIRRGDPEQYQLALLREGSTSMSQHRNDCTIGAGDLMLWDTSRPSDNEMLADRGQARATILMLPREALPLRDQRPELTPPVVAARHNISLRTLHQLFHGQGRASGPGSAGAGWSSAAPTSHAPVPGRTGCTPSPPAGASAAPWSSAAPSARRTESAPRSSVR